MGQPVSLLGQARAFARDFPRDRMPPGYLWDVVDYVPTIIDAALTGRGGWQWGSQAMSGDPETGYYAPFLSGDKLLVQSTGGHLYDVNLTSPNALTDVGAIPRARQNQVQLKDQVIHFDTARAVVPKLITSSPGGVVAIGSLNAAHKFSPIGCIYKSMVVTAGAPGEESTIRFSVPLSDLTTAASFDVNSFITSNLPVTALAALRSLILVFHGGSVERIRGATPPYTGGGTNFDMFMEQVFNRQGCLDPLTIAYWNDNCVFADEHGVHLTDGSIIRNLISQGGILYYWRQLYQNKQTLCGGVFLDYYILTIRRTDGIIDTLVCNLNSRQWIRISNVPALCYIASAGGANMERLWAGLAGKGRLARMGPVFFPSFATTQIQDDDGTIVLPRFETPWYRLGQEGRKRVRFAYLSYDARAVGVSPTRDAQPAGWRFEDDEEMKAALPGITSVITDQLMQIGYIRDPQESTYTTIGALPSTDGYTRYRLPVGQNPYGIAFHVEQLLPSTVTRIFDIAVEQRAIERGRV